MLRNYPKVPLFLHSQLYKQTRHLFLIFLHCDKFLFIIKYRLSCQVDATQCIHPEIWNNDMIKKTLVNVQILKQASEPLALWTVCMVCMKRWVCLACFVNGLQKMVGMACTPRIFDIWIFMRVHGRHSLQS